MMPEHNPVHVPAYLRGEADVDTLAGLVERGRRLGRFWPQLAVEPPKHPEPLRRHPVFRIGAREARLFGDVSD
ncbi:hypothetical protein [Streptacidiphilus jiangxiensis]|uniref:Uncharacterized protein n=1 Tax=Streptacidiphilus jiangxiensis TaxID=235985 RepID=A0A1H7STB9_STRJI|nr:hypothetical protein [Streptacidiphilus jiangxiensis]SEL75801.1 hypothetical protein SAMN05414137_112213 [Streptacidiphilus jiangxiensis]